MENLEAVTAVVVGITEIVEEFAGIFNITISGDNYRALDKLTFLTSDMLGVDYMGNICDSTKRIGEAVCNLSNLVVWGVFLFYLFLSLFGYFLSRKVEIPWKFFVRNIIFGVLINVSFSACYWGIWCTENITEYLINYCGGETSFSYFDEVIGDLEMNVDDEIKAENIFTIDNLIKISTYVMLFLLNVATGVRFILLKLIIIFSPVVLAFGCSKNTEKIFLSLGKLFVKLLAYQIVMVVVLEIFNGVSFLEEAILQIILVSIMFLGIKFVKKLC